MSESTIIGGCASALCLSFIWPYFFQKQWGINGFLRTCPCFAALPCCKVLCSTSSNTVCDCGWVGENDHAYFGTEQERAEAEAREREMRLAWANRIARERERQRILGVVGDVKGEVGAVGQRFHGVTERIPLGFFGRGGRTSRTADANASPTVTTAVALGIARDLGEGFNTVIDTEGVGGMNASKRKSILQRSGDANLDDIVGGSRLRAHRPGSVLYDGAPGVEATPSVRRREAGRVGRSGTGTGTDRGGGTAARRDVDQRVDEPVLNRGTMASQTVVQRQYGPTAPMTIASSLPHNDPEALPPAYK